MSERHFETAPEDRISVDKKLVYGLGGLVNNILGGAMGTMMIVLNLGLGMDPKLVGLLGGLPRFVDALTDPLMGYISDNTRSKWGRRRPYIFIGAIVAGAAYILVWQLPSGYSQSFYFWYFLAGSLIFYIAYTVFATPWVALGYELTPDYHERTRLMGVQNIFGNIAFIIVPWCLWFMSKEDWFTDQVEGARVLAIVVGVFAITVGVLPAIFLRERPVPNATKEKPRTSSAAEQMRNFFSGFATTLKSPSLLKLCIATFLIFNGFQLVA
ncbi:MAG: MFS transporter, partial [Myxococcota bacterium]